MRKDMIFKEGSSSPVRYRVTATRVRREVIIDGPITVDPEPGFDYRMRFTLPEAEAFLSLLLEAVLTARL
jgi:hypothetical protein